MSQVIGYKSNRKELWEAMLIYKQGYKTLSTDPSTMDVALSDQDRYYSILKHYVS